MGPGPIRIGRLSLSLPPCRAARCERHGVVQHQACSSLSRASAPVCRRVRSRLQARRHARAPVSCVPSARALPFPWRVLAAWPGEERVPSDASRVARVLPRRAHPLRQAEELSAQAERQAAAYRRRAEDLAKQVA